MRKLHRAELAMTCYIHVASHVKGKTMHRFYFLLPDTDTARSVVSELLRLGVGRGHIHTVANQNVKLDGLPVASLVENSEVKHLLTRGISAGAVVGTIAGLAAMMLLPTGFSVASGAVLALTLAGTAFGQWLSAMQGVDESNTRYKHFYGAIKRGHILMIVETAGKHLELVENVVRQHSPHVLFDSYDHTLVDIG
jgi:hypothetical protein